MIGFLAWLCTSAALAGLVVFSKGILHPSEQNRYSWALGTLLVFFAPLIIAVVLMVLGG